MSSTARRISARLAVLVAVIGGIGVLSACGTPRVLSAMRDDRVRLGITSAEVIQATGEPGLWVAQDGVETMYFKAGKKSVYVSLVDDKVIAYDDGAAWPDDADGAAREAKKPVSRGAIRVGMTEADVTKVLGRPDGVTAVDGVETLHWVAGDDADSIVELRDGKVVGYVDLATTKFTQNVPRHERETSTTGGAVRLGMTRADVQARIGKPDGVAGRGGREVHRYDTNPVFGNHVVYSVEYEGDRVTGYWQENVTLAKKERAEREAKAKKDREREEERAQEAAGASAKTSAASAVFSFLGNVAVKEAVARRESSRAEGASRTTTSSSESTAKASPSQCSCPEQTCRLAGSSAVARVQSCRASCLGRHATCSCTGSCNDHGVVREHACGCD